MKNITVIIESPKNSNFKYDFNPSSGRFKLSKVLPAGLVFPYDFGFIPGTKGEDGDPVDVMVISELVSYPGIEMDCRPIGAFKVEQTERDGKVMRNDRLLAVPVVSQLFSEANEIDDPPKALLNQLEAFFRNYNEQAGKQFCVKERLGAQQAHRLLR